MDVTKERSAKEKLKTVRKEEKKARAIEKEVRRSEKKKRKAEKKQKRKATPAKAEVFHEPKKRRLGFSQGNNSSFIYRLTSRER
jgi:molybdopterin-biosynthesis enzyme MoeA-like protein